VRARLTNALPGLAHYFGIRPWDIGRLSPRELNRFVEELADIVRESKKRG
jgi:hypothetical protein